MFVCMLNSSNKTLEKYWKGQGNLSFRKCGNHGINRGAELRVHFNIGSQCSVSREILRIKHSAELSG